MSGLVAVLKVRYKDDLFLVKRMDPALSSTSFEIPALFSCQPAGKNSGNFKKVDD